MEETDKTVEEQISNSDFVNALRKKFGEQGEEIAKEFITASQKDKLIILVLLGWKALTGAEFLESMALKLALKRLMRVAPLDTSILIKVLIDGFNRVISADKEE